MGLYKPEDIMGRRGRDRITQFEGVITGYVSYISGCNQVVLQPKVDKDGKVQDPHWYDEQRIEFLDEPANKVRLNNEKGAGFDAPPPNR